MIIFYGVYFPGTLAVRLQREAPRAFAREAYGIYEQAEARQTRRARLARRHGGARRGACGTARRRDTCSSAVPVMPLPSCRSRGHGTDRVSGSNDDQRISTPPPARCCISAARCSRCWPTQRFIAGLHLIQFRHWTLRWIYFGLGLAGCVADRDGLSVLAGGAEEEG